MRDFSIARLVWLACLLVSLSVSCWAGVVTLNFGELPPQPVNGLTYHGVTFHDTTGATYDSPNGGALTYVQDPTLEGLTPGETLTLNFVEPTPILQFGMALSTTSAVPLTPAFTVALFDASLAPIGAFPVNTAPTPGPGGRFSEGQFTYGGVTAVKRAVITFSPAVMGMGLAFGFDNLTYETCLSATSALVSDWPAEGTAADFVDSNPGTLLGGAGFAPGEYGSAFSFNGTTGYVSVANSANLTITGSLTLSAWVYLNAYPSSLLAPVISKWDDITGNHREYFLAIRPDGTVRFDVSHTGIYSTGLPGPGSALASADNALVVSQGSIPLGVWTLVSGVFNSATKTLTVYVNGLAETSVVAPFSTIFADTAKLFIGAGDLGSGSRQFLNGRVDEAMVFKSAVTPAELSCVSGCGAHTVHGHIVTTPPDGHSGDSHLHAAQHGHHLLPGAVCIAPGHHDVVNGHILGLTPETTEGVVPTVLTPETDFVAALNQDGLNAPAAPGTIVQLFGSAKGFFMDLAERQPALEFTPPALTSPLYYTEAMPEVQIGGVQAQVLFSGLAPGLKGVWQINVRIPDGVQSGKVSVTISYQGDAVTSVDLAVF